jgi:nucleotide-binding universal stress UspA family protein
MPKIVLLPVTGSAADDDVFAAALAVGRLFDGHLLALHVRPDIKSDIAGLAVSDGGMVTGINRMIGEMVTDATAHEHAASNAWHTFCERNNIVMTGEPGAKGLTSEWVEEIGTGADWLAAYGRTADLIVVGRGEANWGPDHVMMEAVLMETGKPVLIASARPDSITVPKLDGTIGIAWKDTREAAGAVRAALPFIRAAQHVTIFHVPETFDAMEAANGGDPSAPRLARMLRWHNPNVSTQMLLEHSRPPATVLLDAAAQAGCGLLAMGGYGHSALREALFGGFTRAVLDAAPLAVLVTH